MRPNALAFTDTPFMVNVRMLPFVPDPEVSPVNLKVVSGRTQLTVIFTGPDVLLLAVLSVSAKPAVAVLADGRTGPRRRRGRQGNGLRRLGGHGPEITRQRGPARHG